MRHARAKTKRAGQQETTRRNPRNDYTLALRNSNEWQPIRYQSVISHQSRFLAPKNLENNRLVPHDVVLLVLHSRIPFTASDEVRTATSGCAPRVGS